jgi:NADH dehydrogenase (ubiquinone) Fe-S protein 5
MRPPNVPLHHTSTLFVPLGISSLLTRDNQAARTLALQAAYRKAEANIKRDDAPSAGEIRRLGVLDAPLEEKNLKASKWFPHKEIN